MKWFKLFIAMSIIPTTVVVSSACGSSDTTTNPVETTVAEKIPSDPEQVAALVVGDSVDAAISTIESAGFRYRIVQKDDESYMVTQDYIDDRINLVVRNDKVVRAYTG